MVTSLFPVITVDGPAASGKSTFGLELARHLNFTFVSTGAMYRGVTWYLKEMGVPLEHAEAIREVIRDLAVETSLDAGVLHFRVGGRDPLPYVREGQVNDGVSLVAQVAEVRQLLVSQQRSLALQSPLVMEGRDIGSVVFPETPYKFFLDADPVLRAQRRQQQGEIDSVQKRDALDQQRKESPLLCAPGAIRLDSGCYGVQELVAQAIQALEEKGLKVNG